MKSRRTAASSVLVALLVAVVVVVATFAYVALLSRPSFSSSSRLSQSAEPSSVSTTPEEQPATYSIATPSRLFLNLTLNATTIGAGSALEARFTLFNPLDQNISVTAEYPSNPTIASWISNDYFCGDSPLGYLAAYELFQGIYSPENISSASPLLLTPPVALTCMGAGPPDVLVVLPESSNATGYAGQQPFDLSTNATTGYCVNLPNAAGTHSTECRPGPSLFGYWDSVHCCLQGDNVTTSSPHFHYLPPGQYTLAVEDEWNQTICAPFQVSAISHDHIGSVSVTGPNPPYNPGGPVVTISLRNVGETPIASLNASLTGLVGGPTLAYSFEFSVNSTSPLLPGQTIQSTRTLIDAGINPLKQYPLTMNGTTSSGEQFSYSAQVYVVPPD